MTYAHAAPEFERLPWLNDDARPATGNGWSALILWSILAILLIAGASYWIGLTGSRDDVADYDRSGEGAPSATISLPDPGSSKSSVEQVDMPRMPQVEPVAEPAPVAIPTPRSSAAARRSTRVRPKAATPPESAAQSASETEAPKVQELWPASQSEGAAGRMVRIGTFATRRQAKLGWRQIVRAFPGTGRLRAVVVPVPSRRNGRTYYRLQFGTTSHAHSAILCQWMRSIAQSCVIVGSPAGSNG